MLLLFLRNLVYIETQVESWTAVDVGLDNIYHFPTPVGGSALGGACRRQCR